MSEFRNGELVENSNGLGSSIGWNSWSALKAARRRHPVRLSASVDSIPYMDNDFFSSIGSLSNYPGNSKAELSIGDFETN
ncbi:hypothetical protein Ocin01_14974 [Orchesella cincta]|uniref:Uncharacterized protein n=1 Tax=Orchesella cincta TaxID=48709 RepID=A0A1D2MFC7_ORCCI|nr:hypothetical protein Ocin01_14974 [Orchesella cincta]